MEETAALSKYYDKQIEPIIFDVLGALSIISQIQVASRHPDNNGTSQKIAEGLAKELQKSILEIAPDLKELIEKGWDPEFDVPV